MLLKWSRAAGLAPRPRGLLTVTVTSCGDLWTSGLPGMRAFTPRSVCRHHLGRNRLEKQTWRSLGLCWLSPHPQASRFVFHLISKFLSSSQVQGSWCKAKKQKQTKREIKIASEACRNAGRKRVSHWIKRLLALILLLLVILWQMTVHRNIFVFRQYLTANDKLCTTVLFFSHYQHKWAISPLSLRNSCPGLWMNLVS